MLSQFDWQIVSDTWKSLSRKFDGRMKTGRSKSCVLVRTPGRSEIAREPSAICFAHHSYNYLLLSCFFLFFFFSSFSFNRKTIMRFFAGLRVFLSVILTSDEGDLRIILWLVNWIFQAMCATSGLPDGSATSTDAIVPISSRRTLTDGSGRVPAPRSDQPRNETPAIGATPADTDSPSPIIAKPLRYSSQIFLCALKVLV